MVEPTDTDLELTKRAQQGNRDAFDLLVIKYQPRVLSIIRRYVGRSDDAQDIAQDAFLKTYLALPSFRGDSAFYTWLYRIVINSAKNHITKRRKDISIADIEVTEIDEIALLKKNSSLNLPEAELSRDMLEEEISNALGKLTEDLRVAITLREIEGFSYQEIADVTGCPIGTVRSRIFRAREMISESIESVLDVGTRL